MVIKVINKVFVFLVNILKYSRIFKLVVLKNSEIKFKNKSTIETDIKKFLTTVKKFGRKTIFESYSQIVIKGDISIGDNFHLGKGSRISSVRDNLSVGDNVTIGENCTIDGSGGLEIGSNVVISDYTCVISHKHLFVKNKGLSNEYISARTRIGSYVWLCEGVKVIPGITICDNVIVGAGSIVTRDIVEEGIYVGIPTKKIRDMENERWV